MAVLMGFVIGMVLLWAVSTILVSLIRDTLADYRQQGVLRQQVREVLDDAFRGAERINGITVITEALLHDEARRQAER